MAITGGHLANYNTATSGTSHDLGTRGIGTAASDRYIVAVLIGQKAETSGSPVSGSMTLAGNAMTKIAEATGNGFSDLWNAYVGIFWLNVPTGTTAAFAATTSLSVGQTSLTLYEYNGDSLEVLDFTTASGNTLSAATDLSLDTATGGAAVAGHFSFNHGAAVSIAWTGLTEDYEFGVFSDQHQRGVASSLISSGSTPLSVTVMPGSTLSAGNSFAGVSVSLQEASSGAALSGSSDLAVTTAGNVAGAAALAASAAPAFTTSGSIAGGAALSGAAAVSFDAAAAMEAIAPLSGSLNVAFTTDANLDADGDGVLSGSVDVAFSVDGDLAVESTAPVFAGGTSGRRRGGGGKFSALDSEKKWREFHGLPPEIEPATAGPETVKVPAAAPKVIEPAVKLAVPLPQLVVPPIPPRPSRNVAAAEAARRQQEDDDEVATMLLVA